MLNGNGSAPKVVVVGGSLAGLFNGIALRSLGCEVEVFEKSSGLMKDRGAGIVFQQEVAEFLTRYAVAPLESVVVPVHTRRYLEANGSVAQEEPMPQAMTSWDMLYRKLRAAFGDDHYHIGVSLVGFETEDALYLVPLITLFHGLEAMLVAASVVAPLYAAWTVVEYRRVARRSQSQGSREVAQ